jgi:MFS family permease
VAASRSAIALIAVGTPVEAWTLAGVILGIGTAIVYPTLLAAVGDIAHPTWRASAVGVYRFWRHMGFAVGAIVTGSSPTSPAPVPRSGR